MTSSPSNARNPLRMVLVVVWALVAVMSAGAILLGALTAALNGAGFDTRFSSPTPLFVLAVVAFLVARGGIAALKASNLAPDRTARAAVRDAEMVKEKM